jgi:hypothetical protein
LRFFPSLRERSQKVNKVRTVSSLGLYIQNKIFWLPSSLLSHSGVSDTVRFYNLIIVIAVFKKKKPLLPLTQSLMWSGLHLTCYLRFTIEMLCIRPTTLHKVAQEKIRTCRGRITRMVIEITSDSAISLIACMPKSEISDSTLNFSHRLSFLSAGSRKFSPFSIQEIASSITGQRIR